MRNKQTVKDNQTALRKDNGELTKSDQETADLLSAYFKEVYAVEDLGNLYQWLSKETLTGKIQTWILVKQQS